MENISNFIVSEVFILVLAVLVIILFGLYISNFIKLTKLRKSYKEFMTRLGNGDSVDEMLKKYMDSVDKVDEKSKELISYCNKLDTEKGRCLQKIGLIRYNAFRDTGSDLSFALAILDEYNTGIVLNGIYSREMSNIYAKPVNCGTSSYTLSEEERQAIQKAINS